MNDSKTRILYVDDNELDRGLVRDSLAHAPNSYELHEAATQDELEAELVRDDYDLVLTDLDILGFRGLEVLERVRGVSPDVPVIVVTGTGSEKIAVAAMKSGAADYIIKDRKSIARLPHAIEIALDTRRLAREHSETNAALRESEERLDRAIALSPVPVMVHAEDGAVLRVSDSWLETTGYSLEEIATVDRWLAVAFRDRAETVRGEITRIYESGHPLHEGEFEVICKNGSTRVWEFSSTPLGTLTDGRRLAISVANDVTGRTELEARLRHSEKLEAVGRLAAGVAHDFNNMLQVVLGYAMLGAEELSESGEPPRWLRMIVEAANKSANLTRQLLAFARVQPARPQPVELAEALPGISRLLERVLEESTTLTCTVAADLWPVMIGPAQLDSIVANLVVNARDAINGTGRIDITAFNVPHTAPSTDAEPAGDAVCLRIRDTGTGIEPETLEHIFEPFFTTKGPGVGTGLGLSSVYGIVEQQGGTISVSTDVGSGTSFTITLPRYTGSANEPSRELSKATRSGNRRVILLVEDNEAVRVVTKRLLEKLGYQVVATGDPEHAARLAAEGLDGLALLMTDVVMPGLSGIELAVRIRETDNSLPIVFTSGYPAETLQQHGLSPAAIHFLPKPFEQQELSQTIHEALAIGDDEEPMSGGMTK